MVFIDSQIHGPRDLEACKHNLNLERKWVGSHYVTPFHERISLYPGQHWVYAASNIITLRSQRVQINYNKPNGYYHRSFLF